MDSKRLKVKMTVSVQLQRTINDTRQWIRVLSGKTIGHLKNKINVYALLVMWRSTPRIRSLYQKNETSHIEALYRSLIRFAKSTWSMTSEDSFAWTPRDCFSICFKRSEPRRSFPFLYQAWPFQRHYVLCEVWDTHRKQASIYMFIKHIHVLNVFKWPIVLLDKTCGEWSGAESRGNGARPVE